MSLDFGWIFPSDWLSGMLLFTSSPSLRVRRHTALPAGQGRALQRLLNQWNSKTLQKRGGKDRTSTCLMFTSYEKTAWLLFTSCSSSVSNQLQSVLWIFYLWFIGWNLKVILSRLISSKTQVRRFSYCAQKPINSWSYSCSRVWMGAVDRQPECLPPCLPACLPPSPVSCHLGSLNESGWVKLPLSIPPFSPSPLSHSLLVPPEPSPLIKTTRQCVAR